MSQRPSGLPLAHPGTCPPGLSPCPPQTPRDPASLGSQPCGAKTPRRGSFPRVLTVLSSRLAEPGWAVAQLNSLPAPRGTLSSPLLSSLSGRAPLSLQVYALPTALWFFFCLTFAQAFSISSKALNTPFCTLFLCFARSSCGCSAARSPARGPRPPGAGLSGQCSGIVPTAPPATGRQEVTSCPSQDADYDLEPGGVWKSVSGPPHPSLPAGHTGSCRPRGLTGTAHYERGGSPWGTGGFLCRLSGGASQT